MKKIILIITLFLFCILVIDIKIKTAFIEKIDLNLDDSELAVIFLSSEEYKAVLIKNNLSTSLIVLDYKENKTFNDDLNKFVENKLDFVFLNNPDIKLNIDYSIKDILSNSIKTESYSILKNQNIIMINNDNYNICLYDIGVNNLVNSCDFIYFLNMDYQVSLSEDVKAIFYENKIASKFKENSYIKWIDNYELSNDIYNILKISKDSYDVITIPNKK